jgi:hypothetical protein
MEIADAMIAAMQQGASTETLEQSHFDHGHTLMV